MVIQGAVDLSKNSRIASYLGSQYKKLEISVTLSGTAVRVESGAGSASNGRGLRNQATDATPPIEFQKGICFASGVWGYLENLSDPQNSCPPMETG